MAKFTLTKALVLASMLGLAAAQDSCGVSPHLSPPVPMAPKPFLGDLQPISPLTRPSVPVSTRWHPP